MEVTRRKIIYSTAERVHKDIKYSLSECVGLLKMFFQIEDKSERGRIDRDTFRNFLHNTFGMTDSLMLERIYFAFDIEKIGLISAEQWLRGMSVFLRGTFIEKVNFAFKTYDINNDGYISRDEMFKLLSYSLPNQVEEDPEEGVRDLVEIIFKKLDSDHDGRISVEDFACAARDDPLLLECLGECFPEDKVTAAFLSTFQEEVCPGSVSYISSMQIRHRGNSPSIKEK